jgi:hypothetical protein
VGTIVPELISLAQEIFLVKLLFSENQAMPFRIPYYGAIPIRWGSPK